MEIHSMTLEDLPAVTALAVQLGYPCSVADLQRRFSEMSLNTHHILLVARNDQNQILGWVQANLENFSLLHSRGAQITALVVDEKARGQKIGARLLQSAEEWAWKQGVSSVRLRSNIKREEAHRFYLREDYELTKTSCVFEKSRA